MSIPSLGASPSAAASLFGQTQPHARPAGAKAFDLHAPTDGAGPNAAQPRHSIHQHGPAGRAVDAVPTSTLAATFNQGGAADTGVTLSQALAAYAPAATTTGLSSANLL